MRLAASSSPLHVVIFLVAALGTAVFSASLVAVEWRGVRTPQRDVSWAVHGGMADAPRRGSLRTRRAALGVCLDQDTQFSYILLPRAERNALASACLDYATAIDPAPGALAEAALARAVSHHVLGEVSEPDLLRAHVLAPRVGWLAQRRMDLAVSNVTELTPHAENALRQDIEVMAGDRQLVGLLGQRMRLWPEIAQNEIIRAVETSPAHHQRLFLETYEHRVR